MPGSAGIATLPLGTLYCNPSLPSVAVIQCHRVGVFISDQGQDGQATDLVTAELCMGDLVNLRTARKRSSGVRPNVRLRPTASRTAARRPNGPSSNRRTTKPAKAWTSTGSKPETGHEITGLKRSIVIAGHKTSVSLEDAFWNGLKDVALSRRMTLSDLVGSIDTERQQGNLSSAIRLFVLEHYQTRMNGNGDARRMWI